MKIIKKLDLYIIKGFLQLFAGTFFVCLFIFVMQFLWKWMDDLIGKGLTIDLLAKFFWYSSLTLIPMSLPLAVLLASLISFGNLGERFELLSMKAAGIPLVRILMPLILVACGITYANFYFQNNVGPYATRELSRLAWSMRQKSPELDIPEGIFYSDLPGYNIFVERKEPETGMLYGVMIYTNTDSYTDTQIVLADSGRMQSTADKKHLLLTLYGGERFRNMDGSTGAMLRANVPYMRESFIMEKTLIPFDANFSLMDADLFSHNAQTKNLAEIRHAVDSMTCCLDSTKRAIYQSIEDWHLRKNLPSGLRDSAEIVRDAAAMPPFDSICQNMTDEQRLRTWRTALTKSETMQSEFTFRAIDTGERNYNLRKHNIEWQKKYTMALACLLFFFIGAPLGAIIRKGGLGVPVVVSVIIFIFYYIISQMGENNAKVGAWTAISGTWLSTAVLLLTGAFLTYKANSDSVVFNIEGYRNFFMRLLGLRASRKLNRKEVIIDDPDYTTLPARLTALSDTCVDYRRTMHLRRIPNYMSTFFHDSHDERIAELEDTLEALIAELHNSRDNVLISYINEYPTVNPDAHMQPFRDKRWNRLTGIFLPLGLFFFLRIWRYRLRLRQDLQNIGRINKLIIERITKQGYE